MTATLWVLLLANVANFATGVVTYLKNRHWRTNQIFGLLAVGLIGWSTANYYSVQLTDPNAIFMAVKVVFGFVILQNLAFFLMMFTFPGNRIQLPRPALFGVVGLSALAAFLAFANLIFKGYTANGSSIDLVPTYGLAVFLLHALITVFGGLGRLYYRYRHSRGVMRNQLRYIITASIILWAVVPLTNFLLPIAFHINVFAAFSPVYTLLFAVTIAYAIVTQRLFDIRAVIARTVAYALLVATVGAVYVVGGFAVTSLIFKQSQAGVNERIVYALLSVVLAFTFQPLRAFFERITDRIFYRDKYDSQEVLNGLGSILVSEFKLEEILSQTLAKICKDLNITSGQFYIFNEDKIYRVEHYGVVPKRLITIPNLIKLRRNLLVADELSGGNEKRIMDEYGFRVVMRLRTREAFVGYLMLGDKKSGDLYAVQDLDLLQIFAQELAVAISNAKAYEEIAQFNITLQHRIDDATKRLRVANRHLKELDEAKDEFISMASHQLRTPLTSIKGYLSMVLEGDAGKVSSVQKEFLGYAYDGSERMVNLIADLLNVSRMSAGKFQITPVPTDLAAIVRDEVRQLHTHAAAKNLKLEFNEPPKPLPQMQLDDGKTRQVIMNFIDNAIYYTKEGSVTVTLVQDGDMAELRVKDTGIGVPPEEKTKLFHKFYRADNAQKVRPDGTGLGLFLAKRVVEDQGGTLIFESAVGKGSTFGFRLPIKAAAGVAQ